MKTTIAAPPASTPTRSRSKVERFFEAHVEIRAEGDELPPGVCGRITAIAIAFDVVDTYRTMFAPGCAARSISQRVNARKVAFLMDHDRAVRSHVGVVASMEEIGGAYANVFDLFDTEDGRRALAYAKAVKAANASTGVSIGFVPRRSEMVKTPEGMVERFTEIEIREISLTPMPSIPGADVIGARRETTLANVRDDVTLLTVAARAALDALPVEARTELLALYNATPATPPAPASSAPETRTAPAPETRLATVPIDERMRIARSTFGPPTKA